MRLSDAMPTVIPSDVDPNVRQPEQASVREKGADYIAGWLEAHGWKRETAGDEDFREAVSAIREMLLHEKTGIVVSGVYGCGKTALVSALAKGTHGSSLGCIRVNLADSRDLAKLDDDYNAFIARDIFAHHIFLDDLGAENIENDYGVRKDIVGDFIISYHTRGRGRLLITTNLSADEINKRYGGRVLSRLSDLCVPLLLRGKSKRKWMIAQRAFI